MRKAIIFILALTMLLSCLCIPVMAEDLATPTPVDPPQADQRGTDTLVGVIRFDGWSGASTGTEWGVADKLAQTLTSEYSDRIPFFANVGTDNTVSFGRYTIQTMTYELDFAASAGIDYFAYSYSKDGTGLEIPMRIHLGSTSRDKVKMAAIIQEGMFDLKKDINDLFNRYIKSGVYLRALDDRPVIYVKYTTADYTVNCVNALRKKAGSSTLKKLMNTPFIIILDAPSEADAIAAGGDAMSWSYVAGTNGQAYADLAAAAEAKWEAGKANTSLSIVPLVTTGYDMRPLAAHPVSITVDDEVVLDMNSTADQYAAKATAEELSAHLQKALDFNAANVDKTVFNSVLVSAWNEFYGGAWLCPTQDEKGAWVTDRLTAVKNVLDPQSKNDPIPTMVPTPSPVPTPVPTETPTIIDGVDNIYVYGGGAAVVVVVGLVIILAAAASKKKKSAVVDTKPADTTDSTEPKE